MDVCQTCGDIGDAKRLVYCIKCQVTAEHSYCLDILPSKGDKNVIWTCEECSPRDVNRSLRPSIKSARITQAVETRLNRIKMRKQLSISPANAGNNLDTKRLTNTKQPLGGSSCRKEEIKGLRSCSQISTNEEFKKRTRRLVLEDGSSNEESESVKCTESDPSQLLNATDACLLDVSENFSDSETNPHIHAQPILDPIWRGCLSIQSKNNPTTLRIVAHLSTKACAKAKNAAGELPMLLSMKIFSRYDAWPLKFQIEPPTDESIALYLFPETERDEKLFDDLIDDMIIHDQALKAVTKTVELFVFSSRELPQEHWRFCRKYYLWGVFKSTDNLTSHSSS